MAGESEDSQFYQFMRFVINLGGLAVTTALVALIVATVVVELD